MIKKLKIIFIVCGLLAGAYLQAAQQVFESKAIKQKMNAVVEQLGDQCPETVESLYRSLSRIQSKISYELVMLDEEMRENTEESPPDNNNMLLAASRGFSTVMSPLIGTCQKIVQGQGRLSPFERHIVNLMEGKNDPYKGTEPFLYSKGKAREEEKSSIKLLTLNTCFLPGKLPMLNGGVSPWEDRLSSLVSLIEKSDADVVCLQEVFDVDAADSLCDFLSDKYAHFYLHIAPKVLSKKITTTFGFGSGLLVMSKMPIENPQYVPITPEHPCVNRGVFTVDVKRKGKSPLRIATTHLVAFQNDQAKAIRKKQINEITQNLKNSPYATVLCGDFNIDHGSQEDSEEVLKEFYAPIYVGQSTYCDYTAYWKNPEDYQPKYQSLDYILPLKNGHNLSYDIEVIDTWGKKAPKTSVSDHLALVAVIDDVSIKD